MDKGKVLTGSPVTPLRYFSGQSEPCARKDVKVDSVNKSSSAFPASNNYEVHLDCSDTVPTPYFDDFLIAIIKERSSVKQDAVISKLKQGRAR